MMKGYHVETCENASEFQPQTPSLLASSQSAYRSLEITDT